MAFGVIFHCLLANSVQENFVDDPLPSFNAFYVQRSGLVPHISYGHHAINLMVSNEAFATTCAQGQNLWANHQIIMANYALHDLTIIQINKLVIVNLKESPSGWIPMVRLPIFPLLLQTFQQQLLHNKFIVVCVRKVILLYVNVQNDDDAYSTKLPTPTYKSLMFDLGFMLTLAYGVGNFMKTTIRNQNCEISVRIIKVMICEGG